MPDRDALVQAVLDALDVDLLRDAAAVYRGRADAWRLSLGSARAQNDRADRLDAAADALAALREATT